MASNLSGLLFKEIEEVRQKEEAGKDKEEKEANLSWRYMSADGPGDGQHFSTTKFQNELRQSSYLNDNNASSSDNMRGRSNLRPNGNLYYEQMDRYQQSSDGCVESGELSQETDGCRGINVGAQQWMKMDIVSHPMDECTAGFQEEEMREKLKMDPSELLVYLQIKLEGFTTLLKRKLSPNMIMLVVEILAKITTSNDKELQASLLAHSIHSSVLEQFSTFSFNIIAQNMEFSAEELTNYFENLYVLYNTFVQMMPTKASEMLSDHCTRSVMALQNLKLMRKVPVAPKLEEDYRSLMDHVESLNELHESVAQKKCREKVKREWQPGIDFRELSVIPLPQDLSSKMKVNLCPAVIDGPYKSVEHYLDVQFNLMREDFIIPLREGIMNFIHHQSSKSNKYKRIENVRFYRGVRFLNHFCEGDSLVTEVLFNPRAKSSRHNWSRSKRFLFGTLLCFSSDLFRSVILGLVVDREVELLEKGILRCELVGDVNKGELFEKEFIMAESEVYFEAYQHVLKALQNFTEENFPMKEYLIDVSPDAHYPTYLERLPDTIYRSKRIEFNVLNKDSWPSKEEMEINESQYKALQSALTKKCAVIQGPPGTGKTYLGLKIAKVLLDYNRKSQRGPILVVCYTNHALDQFLEGILSFTRNIVRIGSQSKNEKLDDYNLRVVRKTMKVKQHGLMEILTKIEECTWCVNHCSQIVNKFMKNAGIISIRYLGYAVEKRGASYSAFSSWRDSSLKEWLFEGINVKNSTNLDLDDIEPVTEDDEDFYLCTLNDIKNIITQLQHEASKADGHQLGSIRNEMRMWTSRLQFLKAKLSEPYKPDMNLIQRLTRMKNIDSLEPQHRWTLYRHWVSESVKYFQELWERGRRYFQMLNCKKSEILQKIHLDILSESDVIGMTTTGAARHQELLQKVGPKIVIVEEAAEVMECHIVACLSSQCEHLILIGDHKQLRPSPAVYRLAKDYHLEVSLFERLLMNGIKFDTLRIQHRMRPDIADLVFPAVYPLLENHPSVLAYDNIVGLKKNLFFITHTHVEEKAMDDLSKKNTHEAEFLIALCRYIIMQGYNPSQITILTSYLGQMYLLSEERDKYYYIKNVRIAVVDKFQGEENDIILLSLVRNNEEGKIGFIASENRTCVALSRAKKGLYIIGNLDMLADKSSLWSKIREVLLEKEAVGTHLTLQCLKHPDQLTEVSKAEDFYDVPEGGCRLKCNEKMNCGHICEKVCHPQSHDKYECYEICNRVMCFRDHRCEKQCWRKCGECMVPVESTLSCGHVTKLPCHVDSRKYKCRVEVIYKIPECGHEIKKPCGADASKVRCSSPCNGRLLCGHVCSFKCHVKFDPYHLHYKCLRECARKNVNCQGEHMCEKKCFEECEPCKVKVKKALPNCMHQYEMDCLTDPSTVKCLKQCERNCKDCGRLCEKMCVEPCGDCPEVVEKKLPNCDHKVKVKCCEVIDSRICKEKCMRIMSCGHNCRGVCGIPCDEKNCETLIKRTAIALCGHEVKLYCKETSMDPHPHVLTLRCKEPCGKILRCGHKCKGTCVQCMQGRIHITCPENCERKLICGHKCTAPCSQPCPPCKEQCHFRCDHSQCKNNCGKCSPCQKKCGWSCEHQTCRKNCSDFCDRPPCNEPCTRKLGCGHECIGFCGERCPNLCRVCHPKEVEDALVSLNATGDKNSRFIMLPDCGHVFESTSLEKSLCMTAHVVKLLACPLCHVPIQRAYRYKTAAKNHWNRVMQVKQMVTGNPRQVSKKVEKLAVKLCNLMDVEDFLKSRSFIDKLKQFFRSNKKVHFGASILYSLEARIEFALSVVEHYRELCTAIVAGESLLKCNEEANSLIQIFLGRLNNVTPQEYGDYKGECMRFHIMMELRALEGSEEFKADKGGHWQLEYEQCCEFVAESCRFSEDKYLEMHRKINASGYLQLPSSVVKLRGFGFDLHMGCWYECPNNHFFAVGECISQDKQTVRCDQCNVAIIEGSHRLFSGNNV